MIIAVASRAESKKARLAAWLAERKPHIIDEGIWTELRALLAPVSERYLRQLLRAADVPMTPFVEGVHTHTFEDLERTLGALEAEYGEAGAERRRQIRSLVIDAKQRLRATMPHAPQRADELGEKLLWVMTWLENPEVFRVWVGMRKVRIERLAPQGESSGAS